MSETVFGEIASSCRYSTTPSLFFAIACPKYTVLRNYIVSPFSLSMEKTPLPFQSLLHPHLDHIP